MESDLRIRREIRASLVLAIFGVAYLAYAARYPLDTLANPGPGLFPLGVGVLVVALAAWQVFRATRALKRARRGEVCGGGGEPAEGFPHDAASEWKPSLMVAILVVYLVGVRWAGFFVSTGAIVLACGKLMGAPGWARPIILALGVLLGCYLLFEVWLQVPLPKGYLI